MRAGAKADASGDWGRLRGVRGREQRESGNEGTCSESQGREIARAGAYRGRAGAGADVEERAGADAERESERDHRDSEEREGGGGGKGGR